MNLFDLIETNRQYRKHHIPDLTGLIELDDIKLLSIDTPTILSGSVLLPKNHKLVNNMIGKISNNIVNDTQHKYNLLMETECPLIFKILNDIDGIVLCGGGALWGYMGYKTMPKDFDIFLYDNDPDIENNKITRSRKINEILQIIQSFKILFHFELVKGVITINMKELEIQIILRDYFSISEILHSFDISSCAIAYDGKKTYFTKLAEWSIINQLNVILPEYRSATYEIRLKKYFDRGFGLVFLCLANLDNDAKTIILPNIIIDINCVINDEKTVAIGNVKLPKLQIANSFVSSSCNFDYDSKNCIKKILNTDMFELNCHQFFKKSMFFLFRYKRITKREYDVHKNFIFDDKISLYKIFIELWRGYYDRWLEKLLNSIIIQQGDEFILNDSQLKYFIKYATNDNNELYLSIKKKLENDIEQINYRLDSIHSNRLNPIIYGTRLNAKIELYKDELKDIFDAELERYNQLKNNNIEWCIYLNRDIGLTGSLHVSMQTNLEWYGSYCSEDLELITYNKIDLLKTMHYYIRESCNSICSLCLEPINIILCENAITLKCGHIYHNERDLYCRESDSWNCQGVIKWLKQSKSCPECRDENKHDLIEL
jgi:hypothetical protein